MPALSSPFRASSSLKSFSPRLIGGSTSPSPPSGEFSRARNRLVQRPSPLTEGSHTAITRFFSVLDGFALDNGMVLFFSKTLMDARGMNLLHLHHRRVVDPLLSTLSCPQHFLCCAALH